MQEKSLFMEKYRPQTLDGVVGQEHVTSYLKEFVVNKKIPNLLFSGKEGVGKTTCGIALAKDLFGDNWKKYFYELNASDEGNVETIRGKIKDYAKQTVIGSDFKIIFLDEADYLTKNAQAVLRRTIEKTSKKCRFIFSCNFPNKIIDPIVGRCVVFRFRAIRPQDMKFLLDKVVESEEIDITASALMVLATLSNGSMRKALNTLEKLKLGNVTNITDQTIYETVCYVNDEHIRALLVAINNGDIATVDKYLNDLLNIKTYAPIEILEAMERLVKESKMLTMQAKLNILTRLGDIAFRIDMGANAELQLKTYMAYLILQFQKCKVYE